MIELRARYPDLDDFLGSEFIQDPDDRRSLREVADDFSRTRRHEKVRAVAMDIRRFLRDQRANVDAAFDGFAPQVHPPGLGYTTAAFLAEIAESLERAEAPQSAGR